MTQTTKEQLAEQILLKYRTKTGPCVISWDSAIAAIVEAMNTPAKEVEAVSDNSIGRVLEALDARQQYESEYQLTKPYDIGFHKGTAYAYGEAIELINRLMLHNGQNDERSVATGDAQGTEP